MAPLLIIFRARENWIRSGRRGRVGVDRQPGSFGSKLICGMQSTVIAHCILNDPPLGIPADLDYLESLIRQAISAHKTPPIPVELLACGEMILSPEAVALTATPYLLERR